MRFTGAIYPIQGWESLLWAGPAPLFDARTNSIQIILALNTSVIAITGNAFRCQVGVLIDALD